MSITNLQQTIRSFSTDGDLTTVEFIQAALLAKQTGPGISRSESITLARFADYVVLQTRVDSIIPLLANSINLALNRSRITAPMMWQSSSIFSDWVILNQ